MIISQNRPPILEHPAKEGAIVLTAQHIPKTQEFPDWYFPPPPPVALHSHIAPGVSL